MNATAAERPAKTRLPRPSFAFWAAYVFPILVLYSWFRAAEQLHVEWTVNEQYSFGWAVPILCAFLFWRRIQSLGGAGTPQTSGQKNASLAFVSLLALVAFLFTRWIEEANPDWRLVSWALALEAIFISSLFLFWCGGWHWLKTFAFPLLFFLVAVPWPSQLEQAVVQSLTRGIVAVTAEMLNLFGMPAMIHGNIIETAGGFVDVDEACSGVRSLQAALMISLFFGELQRLNFKKRITLCGFSLALAVALNVCRTVALSVAAAREGTIGVQRWHDPAGIAILLGCFIGIWAIALWLGRGKKELSPSPDARLYSNLARALHSSFAARPRLGWAVLAAALLLLAGEVAIHRWYALPQPGPALNWAAELPRENATFKAHELPRAALQILRFNESRSGTWRNPDGTIWQLIYLRWLPGRVSSTLARNHTPEICLPAAGKKLRAISETLHLEAAGLSLPFRGYTVQESGRSLYVFYSLWEDGAPEQSSDTGLLTWRARWNAVLTRRRNPGQRALHVAIAGASDFDEATASLRRILPQLIHRESI